MILFSTAKQARDQRPRIDEILADSTSSRLADKESVGDLDDVPFILPAIIAPLIDLDIGIPWIASVFLIAWIRADL